MNAPASRKEGGWDIHLSNIWDMSDGQKKASGSVQEGKGHHTDAPASPNSPICDFSHLRLLDKGPSDFYPNLLTMMLDTIPGNVELCRKALQGEDAAELAAAAHKLKTHYRYVGATTPADLLESLERDAREGQMPNDGDVRSKQLQDEWQMIRVEILQEKEMSLRRKNIYF